MSNQKKKAKNPEHETIKESFKLFEKHLISKRFPKLKVLIREYSLHKHAGDLLEISKTLNKFYFYSSYYNMEHEETAKLKTQLIEILDFYKSLK
jgi:hypothetical protein